MSSKLDPTMISIRDLALSFGGRGEQSLEVIKDLTFQVRKGEFVSILGPSGCGKTTLLKLIAGLLQPTAGTIEYLDDRDPGSQRIGLVFQHETLMPWRSVAENIALPLQLSKISDHQIDMRVREMISLVGLEGFEGIYPRDLSGGMAQRVSIARALIQDPDFLLMDEPFGSLDAMTRDRMGDELLNIWQKSQKTVLMVTHSISEAVFLSDRVIVFSPRPARILLEEKIPLPRPRHEKMRDQVRFGRLARQLRRVILDNVI